MLLLTAYINFFSPFAKCHKTTNLRALMQTSLNNLTAVFMLAEERAQLKSEKLARSSSWNFSNMMQLLNGLKNPKYSMNELASTTTAIIKFLENCRKCSVWHFILNLAYGERIVKGMNFQQQQHRPGLTWNSMAATVQNCPVTSVKVTRLTSENDWLSNTKSWGWNVRHHCWYRISVICRFCQFISVVLLLMGRADYSPLHSVDSSQHGPSSLVYCIHL